MSAISSTSASLDSQISYAVAGKAQDAARQQGQMALELLQQAAQIAQNPVPPAHDPHIGKLLDTTA